MTMRFNLTFFFSVLLLVTLLHTPARAATLTVDIQSLRSVKGDVHITLCDNRKCYEQRKNWRDRKVIPVTDKAVQVSFENLAPGEYAIMVFHDEDQDSSFDKNFLGFPQEGFGFSRDARPVFDAPIYESVYLTLGSQNLQTEINMQYW